MSLVSRLFGKKGMQKQSIPPQAEAALKERRRTARVNILPLHNISLRLIEPFVADNVPLSTISPTGIGIALSPPLSALIPGGQIRGELHFQDTHVSAEAKIIHITDNVIGCDFIDGQDSPQKTILGFFSIDLAAASMIDMDTDTLKNDRDGNARWLQGSHQCELYLALDGKQVVRFHLVVFGNYLEGGKGRSFRCGRVNADISQSKARLNKSSLIQWEPLSPAESLSAERFIRNVRQLSEPQCKTIIGWIKSSTLQQA
jgi:hypothetical protein